MLFSGRFDPPHWGHFRTIRKLGREYGKVVVMILDYNERRVPARIVEQMFKEDFHDLDDKNFTILVNDLHFGEICEADLKKYQDIWSFTHYGAGNMDVLRNMSKYTEELAYKIVWVDTSLFYEASKYEI